MALSQTDDKRDETSEIQTERYKPVVCHKWPCKLLKQQETESRIASQNIVYFIFLFNIVTSNGNKQKYQIRLLFLEQSDLVLFCLPSEIQAERYKHVVGHKWTCKLLKQQETEIRIT